MFDLIAVVEEDGDQVVQFSHFSVKEFLTSPQLADSTPDVSRFHIPLRPAHVILARACLGTLLRLGDHVRYNIKDSFPLARYAAEHWMKHAQFEDVSSQLRKGMAYCASVIMPTKTIRRASPSYNMPPRIGSPLLDSWMFHRPYKKGMQCLFDPRQASFRSMGQRSRHRWRFLRFIFIWIPSIAQKRSVTVLCCVVWIPWFDQPNISLTNIRRI